MVKHNNGNPTTIRTRLVALFWSEPLGAVLGRLWNLPCEEEATAQRGKARCL
jgi:hypothetical protein